MPGKPLDWAWTSGGVSAAGSRWTYVIDFSQDLSRVWLTRYRDPAGRAATPVEIARQAARYAAEVTVGPVVLPQLDAALALARALAQADEDGDSTGLPRWEQPPPMTSNEFCAAVTAAGVRHTRTEVHGGPGSPALPTGVLPDGRTFILSDEADAFWPDPDDPMPGRLHLQVHGVDEDDVWILADCTARQAVDALRLAAAYDYSAFRD
jgi:hypothetical protein